MVEGAVEEGGARGDLSKCNMAFAIIRFARPLAPFYLGKKSQQSRICIWRYIDGCAENGTSMGRSIWSKMLSLIAVASVRPCIRRRIASRELVYG